MSHAVRLGVFIVAALVIFAGAVFLIGDKHLLFHHTYQLKAQFDNVAGLNNGAEVRVGGIHEGTVHQIGLPNNPNGKVTVLMDLAPATRAVVKKDSVASIRTEGLVGDQYVELTFGSDKSQGVKDGDTIGSESPLQIADMMKKVNQLLGTAQGAVGNIGQAAGNLDSISAKINSGNGTMGALVNDKSVYQHMNAAANDLQDDMEALKHNFLTRGFFKNRGYEDQSELKAHAITKLPEEQTERQFDFNGSKIFAKSDTAKINGGKNLKDAGEFLQDHPFGLAVVAAFGNDKGDTGKQKQLSEARAAAVREYLANNFKIEDTRVKTAGLGKADDVSKANRLEILVYPANNEADRKAK
jgi:phospholipid/cholesterol/gamma-HCH transport system substrate-binding protein